MEQQLYDLPDGWEWKGFLDVFSTSGFKVGKIPKKDFQTEGSLPIIDQSQSYIAGYCESDEGFSGKLPVIVYGDHTNSVKHIDFKFICGADGTKVLAPKEEVFSWYLFYAISQFRPDSQGYRRHFPILKQKHIPIPPFDEQKRIVAKLDALFTRIDTAIAHLQETLKLSKALFESALHGAFNPNGYENDLPLGWSWKKFKDVCQLKRGYDLPKKSRVEGAFPLFSANGVTDYIDQYMVSAPGVVTGRSGTIGKVHFVETDYWPLNTALYVEDFHGNDERFIHYFLTVFDLTRFASGAAVPTLNRNSLSAEEVCVPDTVDDQRRIVTHLDALTEHTNTLEAETQERLDQLNALKSSLLDAAFRGQL